LTTWFNKRAISESDPTCPHCKVPIQQLTYQNFDKKVIQPRCRESQGQAVDAIEILGRWRIIDRLAICLITVLVMTLLILLVLCGVGLPLLIMFFYWPTAVACPWLFSLVSFVSCCVTTKLLFFTIYRLLPALGREIIIDSMGRIIE
jgi:hypothetical protein